MTKKYENPPPKTSKPVKHLAGKKLEDGSKPEPVSYTHLDVYKRQGMQRTVGR